ncbi:Extra-cytoplasmic solute receptor [Cupriavidus necator]|uniref:Probable extra-cytoplasmic solute receptor n=1 Tax=Cupriavidus necator (strain ATCC 17699 / DSM 428 / KCTC 22496 / NCIMB 10442 / H16 / Stanier 337) TaxID=381666 RepID=Q0K820_CUPNH|nr:MULTISPECIES: tripartite tricarboxylate transporter substrate binding protein [Cupriavidus]EON17114.1 extra-cytoplasmic solute receptor [Cupriavidus sp. GA3-3]KUE90329.1 ABC transporter substrate-binding protein [Cupriavidus necator]QCC01627.1 tripartite tricarboxylate transporter substrate binding protein [Cupriavidus necator H16]QQB75542.1 tripartite tricarboxylate transporter substrate binding protein [Cupriavidus necator]WKA40021.1 tripartite tricarboxylate transporter substrate binding
MLKKLLAAALTAALLPAAAVAATNAYPTKPVRFVVPYPAGGPLDTVARAIGEKLRDSLGQPVVVENKPGAGGNLGADYVAKQPADGYTIVMGAVATHAINPTLFSKMPYDPVKDFAPITLVADVPNVLVMHPGKAADLHINNVRDLVAYARKNPGKLDYASGGNGSAGHLSGELFKSMAKVSMVHIPYNGAAPAQLSVLSGQTDLIFDNLASASANIKAGKLKAFAVTTASRAAAFPELPTIAEAGKGLGLEGFDISTWFGVFAPANTPREIVERLNHEIVAILKTDEMKARLARIGAQPAPTTPEQFAALIQRELKKYAQIVKVSGAKVD